MERCSVPRCALTGSYVAGVAIALLLTGCSWLPLPEGRSANEQTPTATPFVAADCLDPANPVSGLGPCPSGGPPVSATTLACSVAFSRTTLGGGLSWRISVRLALAGDGQPLAGQPVQWTLPQGLVPVERLPGGNAPVTRTDDAGVAVLEVMDAGSTWLGRSLVRASFTDPPPYAERSRILGPSSCSTGVPVPYPPPTPAP